MIFALDNQEESDATKLGKLTERAKQCVREAVEVHIEEYTGAISIGCGGDVTTNTGGIGVGQDGGICNASWIVGDNCSVAKLASKPWNLWSIVDGRAFNGLRAWDCLSVDKNKARKGSDCDS